MLEGTRTAITAQELMRSRYTAYVLKNEAYLLRTWHENTRPESLDLALDSTQWESLTLHGSTSGGPTDTEGTVEFTARYKAQGQRHQMRENSRFVRTEGQWQYLDGSVTGT
ncbi:preprotein translocase SecA [Deinococcus roseus]|uniref:Preprotein translocase SecA n=1 Tax=Deinococcus roseus TaxID=392414 RepID=A0ABQ2CYX5_9DEIO|nr:preprotein translocase SecA [Deinococcus roseus]